ncbi:secreted protein [Beggiatoa sp. PS]|nr:secreted protein [Beggiatoa sp. PS]
MKKFIYLLLIFSLWFTFNSIIYAQENSETGSPTSSSDENSDPSQVPTPSSNDPKFANGFYEALDKTMAFCRATPAACGITSDPNTDVALEETIKELCRKFPTSCGIKTENLDGSTEEGIATCQENPADCGIEIDQNTDGSTQQGIEKCQKNPADCDIVVDPNDDGSTEKGITLCQENPADCDIKVNLNKDGSTEEGIEQCQKNPTDCGIEVDTNTDGSTEEGIRQCQDDPFSCGILVNPNINELIKETKAQCQINPASCGIDGNTCPTNLPELSGDPILIHGFFSLSNGNLYLPAVDVPTAFDGTVTTYEVEMKMIPGYDPLSFSVINAVPIEE